MPRFRKTYIEITNRCDLACAFCAGHRRAPRDMTRDEFCAVLGQLKGLAGLLHLHVMGEPLLHPLLGEFLDLCHAAGFRVNLVTNGWSLATRAHELLGKPALKQLSVSAHSLLDNPNPPGFAGYFGAIAAFARLGEGGPQVSLRLWTRNARPDSARAQPVLRAISDAFGVTVSATQWQEASPVRLHPRVHCNAAEEFQWPDTGAPDLGTHGTCLGLRQQCAILADGTVVPCCLDRDGAIELGNVHQRAVRDILNSSRARAIREGFAAGRVVEPLCRRCAYRLRFGRGTA
jgi:radical SAM protein with 4Fe4S-binding SPASM domain